MGYLTRDEILAARDLKTKDLEVPSWGGTIRVREPTVRERDRMGTEYNKANRDQAKMMELRMEMCSRVIVDERGESVFTAKDIEALGKKSPENIDLVFQTSMELGGLDQKEKDEIAGNSQEAQGSASSTG